MNNKIEKLKMEREKDKAKIEELQARTKELDHQITELENLNILEMVHEHKLSLKQLAELFQGMKLNAEAMEESQNEEE